MASPFGITVEMYGLRLQYTESERAQRDADAMLVTARQAERRAKQKLLLAQRVQAAADELKRQEAAGKARRPARKG